MIRRFSYVSILSLLLIAFLALTVFAASSPVSKKGDPRLTIDRSVLYSFPDEHNISVGALEQPSIGTSFDKGVMTPSPGVAMGFTWYDYQHNGSMGRQIDWGPHPPYADWTTDPGFVHCAWMFLPAGVLASRAARYAAYNSSNGAFVLPDPIQPDDEYAGYVGIDGAMDGRAVVSCHNNLNPPAGDYAPHMYRDFGPGWAFFSTNERIPADTAATCVSPGGGTEPIWPKFRYQEGTDTVAHVFAQVSEAGAGDPQTICYFRKVNPFESAGGHSWEIAWCVDTVYDISQDVVASRFTDKVALVWTGNPPLLEGSPLETCDTCSMESNVHVQWHNHVYYQISHDQGQTWDKRINLTIRSHLTRANGFMGGWSCYTDLSALIDSDENLHILWYGVQWPMDASEGYNWDGRLFHWSEAFDDAADPAPEIRTVANGVYGDDAWDQLECAPGAWQTNMAKMSVSECDGKLYALWTQFNDPANGVYDDCAARYNEDPQGSANGELFIAVSGDNGMTWDVPRNLTNTYTGVQAPGGPCDPAGGGSPCQSEFWASMARFGRQNQAGEDWSGADIVDPTGTYAGDHFLDIQYILDYDAGGIVQDEGTWQSNDVMWFRLACVEPIPVAVFVPSWVQITDPTWTKPGVQLDTVLEIENAGNVPLLYSVAVQEITGPSGWLGVLGASGAVPSGLGNRENVIVNLNAGGAARAYTYLSGRLIFTSNAPSSPDTLPIRVFVTDSLVTPVFDTLSTGCLALTVANNGNAGNSGRGRVNMDWVVGGPDCDSTADVYLYDGSPVIGWIDGNDTVFNWSIFDDSYTDETGFRPLGNHLPSTSCDPRFDVFQSGTFVTHDSSIALQKTWIAPQHVDSCDFIVQVLEVWSYDGQAHNGLTIGEAIDWDIPSDSAAWNTGHMDVTRNLIYQQGAEYHQDDTGANPACQDNDARFGGLAFNESFVNGSSHQTVPAGAYVAENDSFVYPQSGFVPGELYVNMHNAWWVVDSTEDEHSGMCYEPNFNLGATDEYVAVTILATVMNGTEADLQAIIDKANAWVGNLKSSLDIWNLMVDDDGDGIINVCDNCPSTPNDQADVDGDGEGDACDSDIDGDGIANASDGCPYDYDDGTDSDGDGVPDACDACPGHNDTQDSDGDGVPNSCDNCPNDANHNQSDFDADGKGNVCDNCPTIANAGQGDMDSDGIGDVCDPDQDGDGILEDGDGSGVAGDNTCFNGATENCDDNCPTVYNPDQTDDLDADGNPNPDGIGDDCQGGCCEVRGDLNHDGGCDIADLLYYVEWSFGGGPPPVCEEPEGSGYYPEADLNNDDVCDIADLLYYVEWSFGGGPPPIPCD